MKMKLTFALAVVLGLAFGCGAGTKAHAQVVGFPVLAHNVIAIQADENFSAQPFTNCVAFDRLVAPPFVSTFTIPKGEVFVVTSVDWNASVGILASRTMTAALFQSVSGDVNGPSGTSSAMADSDGGAGGTFNFPSGLIVQSTQKLCVYIEGRPGYLESFPASAVAHGYFAIAN